MARRIATGIDIGSSFVRVIVCEYIPHLELLAIRTVVKKPSRGLRHGYIINIDEVSRSITEAVRQAESEADVRIKSAYLAVSGTSLGTTTAVSSIVISRPGGEITDLDVTRVISESESALGEKNNFKIVHTIPLEYKLDGKKITGNPVGQIGNKLEVKTLFITAHQTHLHSLVKAVERAGVEVEDVVAAPIAESIVTLSPLQKSVGCILANIGAETVSVVTFEEGTPIALAVFPIGSSDITNDIALGFKISLDEAENLKIKKEHDRTTKKKIEEIIDARLSDIFELIDLHLKKVGRSGLLPAGIIITGAGSYLQLLTDSAKKYLSLPARIGDNVVIPDNFKFPVIKKGVGVDQKRLDKWKLHYDQIKSPEWSVVYGLCIIAMEGERDSSFGKELIEKTRGKFLGWIKQFLP